MALVRNEFPKTTWWISGNCYPAAGPTEDADLLLKDLIRHMVLGDETKIKNCVLYRNPHGVRQLSSTRYRKSFYELLRWVPGPEIDASKYRYKIRSARRSAFNYTRPTGVPRRKVYLEYNHDQMVKIVQRRSKLKFRIEKINP